MPTFIGFDNPAFDRERYREESDPVVAALQKEIGLLTNALRDVVDGFDTEELESFTGLQVDRCKQILSIAWGDSA